MKAFKALLIVLTVLLAAAWVLSRLYFGAYVDTMPPTITLDAEVVQVSVTEDESALLQGVTAADNRDGDLSNQVQVRSISQLTGENTAVVSYIVFDQADNMATCSRTVEFTDYVQPWFELDAPLNFTIGQTVTLTEQLRAMDCRDGDITGSLRLVSGTLTNGQTGSYHITVQATNSLGDTVTLPLRVTIGIRSEAAPVLTLRQGLVYLNVGDSFSPEAYFRSLRPSGLSSANGTYSMLQVRNGVNTDEPGIYEVIYSHTNSDGLQAETALTVIVR